MASALTCDASVIPWVSGDFEVLKRWAGADVVQQFPVKEERFAKMAREDLSRACKYLLDQPGGLSAAVSGFSCSAPESWAPDLLPFLKWLQTQLAAGNQENPEANPTHVFSQIFSLERIATSPLQLFRQRLNPGDSLSAATILRLRRRLVVIEGEGEQLSSLDQVQVVLGRRLGYVHLSRRNIRVRRMSSPERIALSRTVAECRKLSHHYGASDPRSRLLRVRVERLMLAPNYDMPATLAWLDALPPRRQRWLWLQCASFQQRTRLSGHLRPPRQTLLKKLTDAGLSEPGPHMHRLLALAAYLYDRIRPSRQAARGYVQTTLGELEEYLGGTSSPNPLEAYLSPEGVKRLNTGLVFLASGSKPEGWPKGLNTALLDFREMFLKRIHARAMDGLLALDPAELIRQGLARNQERDWPEMGEPQRLLKAWTQLEHTVRVRLTGDREDSAAELLMPPTQAELAADPFAGAPPELAPTGTEDFDWDEDLVADGMTVQVDVGMMEDDEIDAKTVADQRILPAGVTAKVSNTVVDEGDAPSISSDDIAERTVQVCLNDSERFSPRSRRRPPVPPLPEEMDDEVTIAAPRPPVPSADSMARHRPPVPGRDWDEDEPTPTDAVIFGGAAASQYGVEARGTSPKASETPHEAIVEARMRESARDEGSTWISAGVSESFPLPQISLDREPADESVLIVEGLTGSFYIPTDPEDAQAEVEDFEESNDDAYEDDFELEDLEETGETEETDSPVELPSPRDSEDRPMASTASASSQDMDHGPVAQMLLNLDAGASPSTSQGEEAYRAAVSFPELPELRGFEFEDSWDTPRESD